MSVKCYNKCSKHTSWEDRNDLDHRNYKLENFVYKKKLKFTDSKMIFQVKNNLSKNVYQNLDPLFPKKVGQKIDLTQWGGLQRPDFAIKTTGHPYFVFILAFTELNYKSPVISLIH